MSFEWYRAVAFDDQVTAETIAAVLSAKNIKHVVKNDLGSFDIYVATKGDLHKIHAILNRLKQIEEETSQLSDEHVKQSQPSQINKPVDYKQNESESDKKPSISQPFDNNVDQNVGANRFKQSMAAFSYWHEYFMKKPLSIWVTLMFIVLGIVGFIMASYFRKHVLFYEFLYLPVNIMQAKGEYWRLLTPTFLHFGWMHILFNSLWLWILGARIELSIGKLYTFVVFLFIAIGANIIQGYLTPNVAFGGLSGLVYGLLGFLIIQNKAAPTSLSFIPAGLSITMIAFMILGVLGVMDVFLDGSVANGAHIGGFILGLTCAAGFYFKQLRLRFKLNE